MHNLHQGKSFSHITRPSQEAINKLPTRPKVNETVLILGAGIAGCTAGWVLAEAGYDIVIIEQLDTPFSSTSIGALGIHLGGRYPRDWQTAVECLHSGILMKRLMPFAFSDKKLRFLIANDSPVSLGSYLKFYDKLANYYGNLPIGDQLFGEPEDFYTILRADELTAFTGITGGIATQESCFDMDSVRSTLLKTLLARGTQILTSQEVTGIEHGDADGGRSYNVSVRDTTTGAISILHSARVINTTGPYVRILGQALGDSPMCRTDLRFFQDIELSDEAQAHYPFPFVVIPGYMHYVPLSHNIASLVGFHDSLDSVEVQANVQLSLPAQWRQQLLSRSVNRSEKLSSNILATAKTRFMPHLGSPTVRSIYPGAVVSYNSEQYIKRQAVVRTQAGLQGYYSANPTKASHALPLALEILRQITENRLGTAPLDPYMQKILSGTNIAYIEE